MSLTEEAYAYAVKKKKVNQGVIEAYKDGAVAGAKKIKASPAITLLEIVAAKYRSRSEILTDLGYSDARRGLNEKEVEEARKRSFLDKTIKEFKEL